MKNFHNTMKYLTLEHLNKLDIWYISKYSKEKIKKCLTQKRKLSVKDIQKLSINHDDKIRLLRALLSKKQDWLLACALVERVLATEEKEGKKPDKRLLEELVGVKTAVLKGEYKKTRQHAGFSSTERVGDCAWGEMTRQRVAGNFQAAHAARMVALATESFGYHQIFDFILDYEIRRMEFPSRGGLREKEKELIKDIVSWILSEILGEKHGKSKTTF